MGSPEHVDGDSAVIRHVSVWLPSKQRFAYSAEELVELGVVPRVFRYMNMIPTLPREEKLRRDFELERYQTERYNGLFPRPPEYSNVAIVTGWCTLAGCVTVVEVDKQTFDEKFSDLVGQTLIIRTPRDAYYIFTLIKDEPPATREVAKGVVVYGRGSYVLIPPSTTYYGDYKVYSHVNELYEILQFDTRIEFEMWLRERLETEDSGEPSGESEVVEMSSIETSSEIKTEAPLQPPPPTNGASEDVTSEDVTPRRGHGVRRGCREKRSEIAHAIGDKLLDAFIIKTFYAPDAHDGEIYCYENGVYTECEAKLKAVILTVVPEECLDKFTRYIEHEALHWIKRNTMYKLQYEPMVLAFNNVLLDLKCYVLEDKPLRDCVRNFDPKVVVFHKIPHELPLVDIDNSDFTELAEKLAPTVTKAFRDWVGDKWRLLFEIAGYTLWLRYDLNKAIMLVGEGSNGKSTYLRLLRDILGHDNYVSVNMRELVESRFAAVQLYRKLANIYADLPKFVLRNSGVLKILTGEDAISADRKHREPIKFVNYAKLIFSANELPEVQDMTPAFWRRWIVVEFPNKFPPNPQFYDTLKPEIPQLIILALRALKDVIRNAKFSFEETEEDYKHKWLYNANSVYAFLYDMEKEGKIVLKKSGRAEVGELYTLYTQYCEENDREPLSKRSFTMELARMGHEKRKIGSIYYYTGVEIVKDSW